MHRIGAQSSDVLLARLNHEVEKISVLQHRLAREKALLQEYITRLRLGASRVPARLAMKQVVAGVRAARRRWDIDWPVLAARDRIDREPRHDGEPSL
jgi:hypothetical protein